MKYSFWTLAFCGFISLNAMQQNPNLQQSSDKWDRWESYNLDCCECYVPSVPPRLANRYSDALNGIEHKFLYNLTFGKAKNYCYSECTSDETSQFLKRYAGTIIKRAYELRNRALPKNEVGPEIHVAFQEIINDLKAKTYIATGSQNGPLITDEAWERKIKEVTAIANAQHNSFNIQPVQSIALPTDEQLKEIRENEQRY